MRDTTKVNLVACLMLLLPIAVYLALCSCCGQVLSQNYHPPFKQTGDNLYVHEDGRWTLICEGCKP